MCGRFAFYRPADDIRATFGTAGEPPNAAPSWKVAPTDPAIVRRHPETGARPLDLLRWGLVPHHTADLKAIRRPINARSETAPSSPLFRFAMASRRCLMPADAFYEWQARLDGKQSSPSPGKTASPSLSPAYGRAGAIGRAAFSAPSPS